MRPIVYNPHVFQVCRSEAWPRGCTAALEVLHLSRLDELRELIAKLTPGEKVQTLQWLVRDLSNAFAGIEWTPGVSGGEPCLVRTRIPVWVVVRARHVGSSESDILRAYPSLRAEDLMNAWAYYDSHKAEIDRQILANEDA